MSGKKQGKPYCMWEDGTYLLKDGRPQRVNPCIPAFLGERKDEADDRCRVYETEDGFTCDVKNELISVNMAKSILMKFLDKYTYVIYGHIIRFILDEANWKESVPSHDADIKELEFRQFLEGIEKTHMKKDSQNPTVPDYENITLSNRGDLVGAQKYPQLYTVPRFATLKMDSRLKDHVKTIATDYLKPDYTIFTWVLYDIGGVVSAVSKLYFEYVRDYIDQFKKEFENSAIDYEHGYVFIKVDRQMNKGNMESLLEFEVKFNNFVAKVHKMKALTDENEINKNTEKLFTITRGKIKEVKDASKTGIKSTVHARLYDAAIQFM